MTDTAPLKRLRADDVLAATTGHPGPRWCVRATPVPPPDSPPRGKEWRTGGGLVPPHVYTK
eukprot:scaffold293081_cov33-Tisochrysis_lutea.AAC.1